MKKHILQNQSRVKKIASYSALSCSFIGLHSGLSAQAIYTDINPDETLDLDGEIFLLDLNNDGTPDYKFSLADYIFPGLFYLVSNSSSTFDGVVQRIAVHAYNGSVAGSESSSGNLIPYVINEGDLINGALQFQLNSTSQSQYLNLYLGVIDYPAVGSIYPFIQNGNWEGMTEKFLGLKLIDGGNTYFGWARLTVNATGNVITLHDYAFESTPNTTIIAGDGVSCATPPEVVGVVPASPTSEKLKWTVETGIDYYQIYYRQVGTPTWLKKKSVTNQKTITGLTCATTYEWKVRSNCAGTFSAFSATSTFTTAACRMDDMADVTPEITLYPNPAADFMYIDITTEITSDLEVFVTDMSGRTISGLSFTNDEDMLVLDVAALPAGLYMLSVRMGDVTTTANFVKQ